MRLPFLNLLLTRALPILALGVPIATASSWVSQTVDPAYDRGHRPSIAVDAYGTPHVMYRGGRLDNYDLHHAFWTGSDWETERVTSAEGKNSGSSALAFDSQNRLCAAFVTGTASDPSLQIRFGVRDGGAWTVEPVDAGGGARQIALGVDVQDRPHVAYASGNAVKHAVRIGGEWIISTVATAEGLGDLSLALDVAGRPRITFASQLSGPSVLRYAAWDGAQWQIETVAADSSPIHGIGGSNVLMFDSAGEPGIVYGAAPGLFYACREGGTWKTVPIDVGSSSAGNSTIGFGFDLSDSPQVFYISTRNGYGPSLRHVWRTGEAWSGEVVGDFGTDAIDPVLALDRFGRPHIALRSEEFSDSKCAYVTASPEWKITTVVTGNSAGRFPSIAVGQDRRPRIAYVDPLNRNLIFATEGRSGWSLSTVDGGGRVYVNEPSLRLGPLDAARISYSTDVKNGLNFTPIIGYAEQQGGAWALEKVASTSSGETTSLVLDSGGQPAISYREYFGGVYLLSRSAGGWQSVVASPVSKGSRNTSAAFSRLGSAGIGFVGGFNNHAYAALRVGAVWKTDDLGAFSGSQQFASFAFDSTETPHFAFTGTPFFYAMKREGQWQLHELASNAQGPISLQIDPLDQPQIAYRTGNVVLAARHGVSWTTSIVTAAGKSFSGTYMGASLAVDSYGVPHIAFLDGNTHSMQHATYGQDFDSWVASRGSAGDEQDLLRYAFNEDARGFAPDRPRVGANPVSGRMEVQIALDPSKPDLTFEVQFSSDLTQPWKTLARVAQAQPAENLGAAAVRSVGAGLYKIITVEDAAAADGASRRFARVRVSR